MATERLEVRIDSEQRRKLDTVARERAVPVSHVVRAMIEEAYEAVMLQRRLEAVRRIAALEVEDVPDPEELSRQLDETYAIPDPYAISDPD